MKKMMDPAEIFNHATDIRNTAHELKALEDVLLCAYSVEGGIIPDPGSMSLLAGMMLDMTEKILDTAGEIQEEAAYNALHATEAG